MEEYELEKAFAESDDDVLYVVKISNEESLSVTRGAKNAMDLALEWTQNIPSPYNRCEAVALAFCKLLGKEMVDYMFTMTKDDIQDRAENAGAEVQLPGGYFVDWVSINPTEYNTYPKRNPPTDEDYTKVRAVYKQVKSEKDAIAKRMGHLKSTIQAWNTFRGHLTTFRDWAAFYYCMYPKYNPSMLMNQMKADLKMLQSVPLIHTFLASKISKVRVAIRNKRKSEEIEAEKAALKIDTKKAKSQLKRATTEKTKNENAIANMKTDTEREKERAKRNLPILENKISEAQKKMSEAQESIGKASTKIATLAKTKQKLVPWKNAKVQSRVSARNNVNQLNDTEKPSEKAARLGDGWLPPRRLGTGKNWNFSLPGDLFKEHKGVQLNLLYRLAELMRVYAYIGCTLDFPRFIADSGAEDLTFPQKLFLYCIYHICWGYCEHMRDAFEIAKQLKNDEYAIPTNFTDGKNDMPEDTTEEQKKQSIAQEVLVSMKKTTIERDLTDDQMVVLIGQLQEMAAAWIATEATFPSTFDELKQLPHLSIGHAREMAYQCFGESSMTVTKHTRKMAIALDFIDWEECGIDNKCSTSLTKIRDKYVLMSIRTWLPKSEWRKFHTTIDPIAEYLGPRKSGTFGKVRDVVKDHFSKKEQAILMDMVNNIIAFYKYHKSGGRERVIVGPPVVIEEEKDEESEEDDEYEKDDDDDDDDEE